jgi:hypothetical protein
MTLISATADESMTPDDAGLLPGTILPDGGVACGSGVLRIALLHPDSRQPLSRVVYSTAERTKSFWQPGHRLEPVR